MKYCIHCGKELQDGTKFCVGCGAPVADPAEGVNPQTVGMNGNQPLPGNQIPEKKKSKSKVWMIVLLVIVLLVVAIGGGICLAFFMAESEKNAGKESRLESVEKEDSEEDTENTSVEEETTEASTDNTDATEEVATKETEVLEEAESSRERADAIFKEVAGDYYFSSGAGGWGTGIAIDEKGYFEGDYHDSNMGESGDGYDATVYISNFNGRFGNVKKIDDYTYSAELLYLDYEEVPADEWIESVEGSNVRYIAAGAYGLDGAKEVMFYLPGKPVDELSEEYISWVFWSLEEGEETLPFYGLYNVDEQLGFSGER